MSTKTIGMDRNLYLSLRRERVAKRRLARCIQENKALQSSLKARVLQVKDYRSTLEALAITLVALPMDKHSSKVHLESLKLIDSALGRSIIYYEDLVNDQRAK